MVEQSGNGEARRAEEQRETAPGSRSTSSKKRTRYRLGDLFPRGYENVRHELQFVNKFLE